MFEKIKIVWHGSACLDSYLFRGLRQEDQRSLEVYSQPRQQNETSSPMEIQIKIREETRRTGTGTGTESEQMREQPG